MLFFKTLRETRGKGTIQKNCSRDVCTLVIKTSLVLQGILFCFFDMSPSSQHKFSCLIATLDSCVICHLAFIEFGLLVDEL